MNNGSQIQPPTSDLQPPILKVEQLSCRYGAREVFAQLDLAAAKGEVLALLGPNGAGKSTLLRCLARLQQPQQGQIWLNNQPLWQMKQRLAAQQIAFAPQNHGLNSDLTVEQMLLLGRTPHRGWLLPMSKADRAIVEQLLERFNLTQYREQSLAELSGGEQRRVIIARALAQQPSILLLDEPTAHLDLKYQLEIMQLVSELAHSDGVCVILTLHDLNQASLCADRIALLAHGRLQAVGPPSSVLRSELIEAAYDVPVQLIEHPSHGLPLVMLQPQPKERSWRI
ncbi:ABC transporter ATP-binding protein [Herpetosiphon sp. NSE202]|uniref:ABC transporter ATP-binding protein n=1 Tax=Herpetosiphon sp. NSE202 TaxID=3351349 RepID=UPI003630A19D